MTTLLVSCSGQSGGPRPQYSGLEAQKRTGVLGYMEPPTQQLEENKVCCGIPAHRHGVFT